VLTPTHAHVRVQSKTPTQGAPILAGDGARQRSSGRLPAPITRPAPRVLPWLLLLLLLGSLVTAIAWRLAMH
jgi:hypothetical protein